MKAQTLLKKAATGLSAVALTFALGACSHHNTMAQNAGQQTGQIRTEQASQQQASSGEVLGTAPAPANVQGTTAGSSTPAVISGPAAVDSTGRAYTSSSVGSAGNAASVGTNTNVNIKPNTSAGTVTVAESPAPAPLVTTTPEPAPVTTETTTETTVQTTPAPAPPVVESTPAPAPMTSSTTETTTTTKHKRLRKD